jgi:hypothetical protein
VRSSTAPSVVSEIRSLNGLVVELPYDDSRPARGGGRRASGSNRRQPRRLRRPLTEYDSLRRALPRHARRRHHRRRRHRSGGSTAAWRPGVTIVSYGFEQEGGLQQGFLYTDPGDLEADYDQAINTYGAEISNNSIGTNTAPNGFPCEWEGDYGVTAA